MDLTDRQKDIFLIRTITPSEPNRPVMTEKLLGVD